MTKVIDYGNVAIVDDVTTEVQETNQISKVRPFT